MEIGLYDGIQELQDLECPYCRVKFQQRRYWQKFCSKTCREKFKEEEMSRALEMFRNSPEHETIGRDRTP